MKGILLTAALAVAFVGCQQRDRGVPEAREDLAQAQDEAAQDVGEARQDAQQQVGEEREDLAQARQDQAAQQDAGSPQQVEGVIAEAANDSLTVRTQDGREVELELRNDVAILENGSPTERTALREGSQVRASYLLEGTEQVAQRIEIMQEQPSAPQPSAPAQPAPTEEPSQGTGY